MNDGRSRSNRDLTPLLGAALILIGMVAIVALVVFTVKQLNPDSPTVAQEPTLAPAPGAGQALVSTQPPAALP